MSNPIIRVEHLSKKYTLSHQQKANTFRDALTQRFTNPFRRSTERKNLEEFWALRDVSFEIQQGDRVGIIGRNGAGKSTLLKILSRITAPTQGEIRIKGRVASLLEVGTGFHPELTGRENIFLNGAILGMGKAEIRQKLEEIVAFAEIEKFLDTPVKRYSSGMYVRLAFAVAAHLEPEILIVDEVLAVGDAQFQKKCLGRMNQVAQEGRTILFVSHNMAAIRALCSKGIVLDQGQIICSGDITHCKAVYEEQNLKNQDTFWIREKKGDTSKLVISQIYSRLSGEQPNLSLELDIHVESREKHKPAFLAVDISTPAGVTIMQALPELNGFILDQAPFQLVNVNVQLPPLIPGQYLVSVWLGSHNTETFDFVGEAVLFEVDESPTRGRSFPHSADHGYIVPASFINHIRQIAVQK